MIRIINQGQVQDPGNPDLYLYSLYINDELITTFTHFRSDGLARCLHEASHAVSDLELRPKEKR